MIFDNRFGLRLFSFVHCRFLRSLNLNQLTGVIPPELAKLSQLFSLYAYNHIVLIGNIRNSLMIELISPSVAVLEILIYSLSLSLRDLSMNKLNGTIPPEVGNLTNLNTLYDRIPWLLSLGRYSIPECVRTHSSLSLSRDLNSNQLTGTIPPQFGKLTNLSNLYVHNRIVLLDHLISDYRPSHI